MRKLSIISTFAVLLAGPVQALGLEDCRRITHPSHGGQYGHRDLGEGRVSWVDWWTQEGAFKGYTLVDCASGETLRFRTAEENMGPEPAFDRTDAARAVLERHHAGARVFATFERMAADLEHIARKIEIFADAEEICGCAAAYPDLRGDKTEFQLAGRANKTGAQRLKGKVTYDRT
ncbi:MAG: hypothetical protein ACSHW1_05700 [Yoonia sp.]|uniref:hypothetical protein n=1 Tax=Yoonia sp. TaxID=2212373 RepID=UPI003EF9E950